tara:strand:- start:297 stop:929 length:633 start_codon:yes stop_codon:yes gene_type:complete
MYKVFFTWLVFIWGVYAHQADVSTTMLVQRENGTWILQVSASLTAFQYQVKANNPDNPYKTPEEFKEMVIEHLKNNLSFVFNGNISPSLQNAQVILGHETKVVFEVVGIPENIVDVAISNSSFKGIHKNQSKLLFFKNGFQKEVFTLNDANDHSLTLIAGQDKFTEKSKESKKDYSNLKVAGIVFLVLGLINILWFTFKNKKPIKKVISS